MTLLEIQITDAKAMLELDIWYRFTKTKDRKTRNELTGFYLPFVKQVSGYIFRNRATHEVEYDEYYQFGVVGLLEAIDRYQYNSCAVFTTYATYRIKGSIYSGLASLTEKRSQYKYKNKLMAERLESLEINSGDANTFEELINVTIGIALGYLMQGTYNPEENNFTTEDLPYQHNELKELSIRLRDIVENLPEKENIVIVYHYFRDVSFEDIRDILEVTKGRVSQLHKDALKKIRNKIRSQDEINHLV